MKLDKFRQGPEDRKRYVCDYADWMNASETLVGVTMEGNVVDDFFAVNAWEIDGTGKQVIYYITGGVAGRSYNVTIEITTSLAQVKNDYLIFEITEGTPA